MVEPSGVLDLDRDFLSRDFLCFDVLDELLLLYLRFEEFDDEREVEEEREDEG